MRFADFARADSFDHETDRSCRNCGNSFHGRYCNRCGEKVLEQSDKSLVNILGDYVKAITFLDNKVFRTFRLLVLKTGELTRNVMNGVRVPFLRPVSVFFVVNLVYFLFPVFDTFNSNLRTQMHFLPHSTIAQKMVEERIEKEDRTLHEFTIQYRQQSTNMAKLLLIIFVFLVAVPLALINYSSHLYFYDNLLVSFEYNSIMILMAQIVLPRLLMLVNFVFFGSQSFLNKVFTDSFFSWLVGFISLYIFYVMERRVYAQDKKRAWIKAFLLLPGVFIALQVYRMILFFVTMWTL